MKKQIMASILVGTLAIGMSVTAFAGTTATTMPNGDRLSASTRLSGTTITGEAKTGGTIMDDLTVEIDRYKGDSHLPLVWETRNDVKRVSKTAPQKSMPTARTTASGRYNDSSLLHRSTNTTTF